MKKKKNKNNLFKFPEIKKDITAFLTSEEGKVTKKKIVIGAITLAMLSIATDSFATHTNHGSSSGSYLHNSASMGRHYSHAVHSSHGSHNSW